jgi:hypothetical protein
LDCGFDILKTQGLFYKIANELVSSNYNRWIQNQRSRLDREERERMTAALRPENSPDGGFRGGAIAGDCKLVIYSITS